MARKLTAYNKFVSREMRKLRSGTQVSKMRRVARMWRSQGKSKSKRKSKSRRR